MPKQQPQTSKQNYRTPLCLLNPIKTLLGIEAFKHDFAADRLNAKARTYFDEQHDALKTRHWQDFVIGGWGWLNPPYKDITPWARRCRETQDAGGSIAFLVPASVGANWYRDYIHRKSFVLALNGRIPFIPEKPTWLYPKDCMLVLFSPQFDPDFDVWTWRA